jgi:hypothetical protein
MTTDQLKDGASYWHRQFQFQQNMNDGLQAQLRKLEAHLEECRNVIVDAKTLHRESKFMETVSYCDLCTERWPCKSIAILARLDNASSETVNEGVGS